MVERTEKGKEVRQYFINCEKRAMSAPDLNDPAYLRQLCRSSIAGESGEETSMTKTEA